MEESADGRNGVRRPAKMTSNGNTETRKVLRRFRLKSVAGPEIYI